ncbi:MAG: hypothetical protein MI919_11665 [Holophagales bacterium]|nr:hypothetical protein [Holophagales bacterium]
MADRPLRRGSDGDFVEGPGTPPFGTGSYLTEISVPSPKIIRFLPGPVARGAGPGQLGNLAPPARDVAPRGPGGADGDEDRQKAGPQGGPSAGASGPEGSTRDPDRR